MLRFILTSMILLVSMMANATSSPASLKYLNGYFNKDPDAAVTVVTGKPMKAHDLDEYRGLTLLHTPEKAALIEAAVKKDAQTAEDKEVSYRKGALYYAFLTLTPGADGKKRYLFYLNQTLAKGDKIILIYMSGKASADKIRKMIKK